MIDYELIPPKPMNVMILSRESRPELAETPAAKFEYAADFTWTGGRWGRPKRAARSPSDRGRRGAGFDRVANWSAASRSRLAPRRKRDSHSDVGQRLGGLSRYAAGGRG